MPYRRSCAACALAAALLLSGCSAVTGSDVESLLRAPQASGETSAVQKALPCQRRFSFPSFVWRLGW